ncbi:uncharacterized protein [Amphiura filiformis]|uniref:uncharacterized protein n=1 Tax=Amphiura filiformis TaxID=82378 RepID=UPI003B217DB0
MSKRVAFLFLIIYLHLSCSQNDKKNAIPGSKDHMNEEDNTKRHHKDVTTEHVRRHHRRNQKSDPVETSSSRLQLFEQTDADGDGFVTRKEYISHSNLHDNHTADLHVDDLFVTYDRDNDGQLSELESVDQSSPWDVMSECEFLVMQRCNAVLDRAMSEVDNDLEEPICGGLQSYLDCIVNGQDTDETCVMESYILSVKQNALVLRSSGLCPNLEIGQLDFDIEIDYEPRDDLDDEYNDEDEEEYSSDSLSSSVMRAKPGRFVRDAEDSASEGLDSNPPRVRRKCSSSSLIPCVVEFEARITKDIDIKSNLELYRQCVSDKTNLCETDKQNLLLRESLKIIAKKGFADIQNELTKDARQEP